MAEQLARTIHTVLKKQGLWTEAMRWTALSVWTEVVGERVAGRARPFGVNGHCLLVAAESPAWRQELHLLKPAILKKLNDALGGEFLKDIRFVARRPKAEADTGEQQSYKIRRQGYGYLESISLDRDRWKEIEALLSLARDDDTRRALGKLLVTLAKRDAFLRSLGMRPCPACGALDDGSLCAPCRLARKRDRCARALSLLSEAPWLDERGMKEIDPSLGEEEYQTARDVLLSVWSKEMADLRRKRTKSSRAGLRLTRARLAMLLTHTPPDGLTEETVDLVVPEKTGARTRMA